MLPIDNRRDAILIFIGFYVSTLIGSKTSKFEEVREYIDQKFSQANEPPTTAKEWEDVSLALDVGWVLLMQAGMNRKDLRS